MPQGLFPILALATVAVLAAGAFVATGAKEPGEPVADINHATHIEMGLECVDCHTGVESAAAAGVPGIAICAECHDGAEDSISISENGRHILAHVVANEELWWPRFFALPDDIVFSHRRHVALGEIECAVCHGEMQATTTFPDAPLRRLPSMEECMDCHRTAGADLDCYACHK